MTQSCHFLLNFSSIDLLTGEGLERSSKFVLVTKLKLFKALWDVKKRSDSPMSWPL